MDGEGPKRPGPGAGPGRPWKMPPLQAEGRRRGRRRAQASRPVDKPTAGTPQRRDRRGATLRGPIPPIRIC